MNNLSLATLRKANMLRLPQFKNCHGEPAHTKEDGSDWSPAQWLQAVMGELGELCEARLEFEEHGMEVVDGKLYHNMQKEAADVQTYHSIAAVRMYDLVDYNNRDNPAQVFMQLMAKMGTYANARKKFERGDYKVHEFMDIADMALTECHELIDQLATVMCFADHSTSQAHAHGIDLGQATVDKFNEVSRRVKSDIFIDPEGNVVSGVGQ